MSKFFPGIEPALREFIERQHIFFTASAAADSRINLSPKGSDCLRVIGPNEVAYLDQTGSGNEAAAHLRADGRLTIMFCAFEGAADDIAAIWPRPVVAAGQRACMKRFSRRRSAGKSRRARVRSSCWMSNSVQTSCGYSVPLYDLQSRAPDAEKLGFTQRRRRDQEVLAGKECRQHRWLADRYD